MNKLKKWQDDHCISTEAMNDLSEILGLNITPIEPSFIPSLPRSEAAVQVDTRLFASKYGDRLWRNNVGVAKRDDGVPIRYGLCNESKKMNQMIKSSDLIGIKQIHITIAHVGMVIGQFYAREVKKSDWFYTGTDREIAQMRFHGIVNDLGGDAKFINNAEDLYNV